MKNNLDFIFKNSKYILTTSEMDKMPSDEKKEVVIIGKSNVGKSTFINFLTNNSKLAKISSSPGKTRAISFFDIDNKFRLVDIPGYGYARVSKAQLILFGKMVEHFFSQRKNIDKVIFLLDMRREISLNDIEMFNYLIINKIKFIIIGTKADKCNQSDIYKFNKNVQEKFKITPINYSSLKKNNIEKIKPIFLDYYKN